MLPPQWDCIYVIAIAHGHMTCDAFIGEPRVFTIRSQAVASPSRPSPTLRGCVFLAVADHEFYLEKRSGSNVTLAVVALEPGDFCEGRAIGPRVDMVRGDRLDAGVIGQDYAHGLIVETIGGADRFPVLVGGREFDSVGRGGYGEWLTAP